MNRKCYMLVEIILASVIAFGIAYFLINLTIKLKNKNDDMFVETLVETDRAIITNKIMENIFSEDDEFDCSKLNKDNNTIIYNNKEIDIVNEYTQVGNIECQKSDGYVSIKIPLSVIQMSDKNYDILINHNYQIGDSIAPYCKLGIASTKDKIVFIDSETGDDTELSSYTIINGTDKPDYDGVQNNAILINEIGTYTGYVKDKSGNENTCSIDIVTAKKTCVKYFDECSSGIYGHGQGNAGICYQRKDLITVNMVSNTNCTNRCSGFCNGSTCNYCESGYEYSNSDGVCIKVIGYPNGCSGSGWEIIDGKCQKDNQSSCPSGSTTKASCSEGYTKINEEYCYKN